MPPCHQAPGQQHEQHGAAPHHDAHHLQERIALDVIALMEQASSVAGNGLSQVLHGAAVQQEAKTAVRCGRRDEWPW